MTILRYTVTVTATVEEPGTKPDHKGNVPALVQVERQLYEQTVDTLNLPAVICAVNLFKDE